MWACLICNHNASAKILRVCARRLFPETGDTIITEEVRKVPTMSVRKIGLSFVLEATLRALKAQTWMGSGSGAISSEGVNDFHFFGSPHKLLSPGAGTFVLLARGPVFRRQFDATLGVRIGVRSEVFTLPWQTADASTRHM